MEPRDLESNFVPTIAEKGYGKSTLMISVILSTATSLDNSIEFV